jgi:hypothetical protein
LDHSLCEGIPVLQPSRFYPYPSGLDQVKAVQELDVWKFYLTLSLQFIVYFGEEIKEFRLCRGRFFPTEISASFENFLNDQQTTVEHFRCPTNHYREGC